MVSLSSTGVELSSTADFFSSTGAAEYASSTGETATTILTAGIVPYGIVCFIIVVCFTGFLVWNYARPKLPPTVGALVFLAWLCTFVVCFLVPIDLIPNVGNQLDDVWSTLFWISFLLMWFIIPVASGYYDNGAFTFKQKMKASMYTNGILFGIAFLLLVIGVIYLRAATSLTWDDMTGLAVAASNTWGLVILVLLAGYGLIEFPRTMWHHSQLQRRREEVCYGASAIRDEAETSRDDLHHTLAFLKLYQERVDDTGNETFQEWFRSILNECREEELKLSQRRRRPGPFDKEALKVLEDLKKPDAVVNEVNLIKLNLHVKNSVRHLSLVDSQWRDAVKEFVDLDAAIGSEDRAGGRPPPEMKCWAAAMWYLRIRFIRRILRATAFFSMFLSALLIWMEFFLPFDINVSPLGAILSSDAVSNSPLALQLFSIIPITYLCICTSFPLFNMRLSKFYYIGPHRTDEGTLLFNATFMLRSATPLAYNFVLLLKMDATSLVKFIGVIDVIPFFGSSFTTVFPWFIFVISLMTLLNVWAIVGRLLKMERFQYLAASQAANANGAGSGGADDDSHQDVRDAIAEGKKLIETYLRNEQRAQEQLALNADRSQQLDAVMLV